MGFLQPLLLLGMLGVAVPIAVHLVNRKKAVRQSFPAIWLLVASKRQTAPASSSSSGCCSLLAFSPSSRCRLPSRSPF